jgi:hypothetical protein
MNMQTKNVQTFIAHDLHAFFVQSMPVAANTIRASGVVTQFASACAPDALASRLTAAAFCRFAPDCKSGFL